MIDLREHDRPAAQSDGRHLLTLRRVVHLAIVAELARLSVPIRLATAAAYCFTDAGEGDGGWAGEIERGRGPGQHFAHGDAVLVLCAGEEAAVVINVRTGNDAIELVAATSARVVLNVTPWSARCAPGWASRAMSNGCRKARCRRREHVPILPARLQKPRLRREEAAKYLLLRHGLPVATRPWRSTPSSAPGQASLLAGRPYTR